MIGEVYLMGALSAAAIMAIVMTGDPAAMFLFVFFYWMFWTFIQRHRELIAGRAVVVGNTAIFQVAVTPAHEPEKQ